MASLQEPPPPQERRHLSPRQLKVQRPALSAPRISSPRTCLALSLPRTSAPRTCPAFSAPGSLHPDLHAPHLPSSLRTPNSPPHHLRTQTFTPLLQRVRSPPASPPLARTCVSSAPKPQPARSSLGLWEAESFRGQAAKVRKVEGTGGLREGLRARPLPPYLFRAVGSPRNCKPLDTCQ